MGIEPISSVWKTENLPLIYTRKLNLEYNIYHREDIAQLVRALACHAKGCGFKSRCSR